MILKDFEFLDIFIESKWGVFPYLHLCFKVNVNKYVQYPGLGKGLQKEETKFLKLVIDYTSSVINYKSLYMSSCKVFPCCNRLHGVVIDYNDLGLW